MATQIDLLNSAMFNSLGLSHNAHHVLLLLIGYRSNKTKLCYPSVKTMAKDSGMSERNVYRGIDELEKSKLIFIHRSHRQANQYTFNLPPYVKGSKGKRS